MSQIEILVNALEYIENNLHNNLKTIDIATNCYCSRSALERIFKYMNSISIHDYITRRKMTKAAKELTRDKNNTLLDIALKYGYSSNESFTRAFKKTWHCNPSEYRKNPRYYELFPRLLCPLDQGGKIMRKLKHVDISELYDLFTERKKCYFVCCDIKGMIQINHISRELGDQAIIESLNRMYLASGEDDVVFRIGGDEFVILTNSTDLSYAQKIASSIAKKNGKSISYEDQEAPLSLYTTITRIENKTIKYSDLFLHLHNTIKENK